MIATDKTVLRNVNYYIIIPNECQVIFENIKTNGDYYMEFSLFPILVIVIITAGFLYVIGSITVAIIKGGLQWNKNNNSPVLTVYAKVTAKRMAVDNYRHGVGSDMTMHHTYSVTSYFSTFETEDGNRLEFKVPDSEYGMLAEGDAGRLTFQGTRYKGFERVR